MELLQLKYFYETARNQSIAKTAKEHMVPPSSVSASIKRLESELGVSLFNREANKITLSEKGHAFADALGEILEKLQGAVATVCENDSITPEICILIQARRKWITELIIEYKKVHPTVQFRIFNDVHSSNASHFDIIVDEQTDKYESFKRFLLCTEQICIKAAKSNRLVGKELCFGDLKSEQFIMPRKAIGIRKLLEDTGKKHGFEPNIAIECNDSYCLSKYVKADMGLTLGSYRALKSDVEAEIVPLNVTDFCEMQAVYVYHQSYTNNAVNDFCDFLKQKGEALKLI